MSNRFLIRDKDLFYGVHNSGYKQSDCIGVYWLCDKNFMPVYFKNKSNKHFWQENNNIISQKPLDRMPRKLKKKIWPYIKLGKA